MERDNPRDDPGLRNTLLSSDVRGGRSITGAIIAMHLGGDDRERLTIALEEMNETQNGIQVSVYDTHTWMQEVVLMKGDDMFTDDSPSGQIVLQYVQGLSEDELREELALLMVITRTKPPPVG